ncbi:hypothetical protein BJY52DRAFT_1191230 [Lactarius psammicola]|nr:hypothetical protein BJY52DRAFT_1191230 [Lactarius psammicola]
MQSILSRLRTRAVSQNSPHSAQSVHPAPTTATTVTTPTHDEQAEQPITEPPIQAQGSAPVTRKIYRDLDLLTNELATEPSSIRRGLPPPVRRGPPSSSNPSTPILGPAEQSVSQATATATAKGDSDSPKVSQSSSSSGNSAPHGRGFIERLGDWSTFGRRRAPPPSLNEFGATQISPSPSAWRTRRTNSRLSSRPSSNRTTTSTHSSPHENNNKENTPRPSYQSSSDRRMHKRISTFGGREPAPDPSPVHTLENPSPEVSTHTVPPLPPLEHPALRSRGTTATYPPHARRAGMKNDEEITPGRFTFGSLRPYRSLPRVQHIFKSILNQEGDKGDRDVLARAGDDESENKGQGQSVPVPTGTQSSLARVSVPILPIPSSFIPTSPPSSSSSSSKSAPAVGSRDPHDPIPSPCSKMSPRVHDRKPLRSSLKASARPPIASSSSSNGGASAHMPSLVAAVATVDDGAVPRTPVSTPGRSETAKGKRKAEDVDTTPPDPKKATFAVPASPREHTNSLAPSSYHNKRARLSGPSPTPTPSNAHNTGTYSSRTSSRLARAPSSTRSAPAGSTGAGPPESASERERRRSVSQRSIPISALVTPHAPSIGRSSAKEGSPVQAWLFYIALVLFPLWWVGAVWRVPETRVVGGTDTEKAVPLDDPQIEFDARSWRFRCRVMAVVSLFTYVPFIVLVAIFAGR